ncbi:ATPase [bacterium]|nr:ATPase [bacterium]
MLTVFIIFVALGFGAVKAFAQAETFSHDDLSQQTEGTQKHTDKDVVKFAFLSAAIAVGVGAIGGGAAVGYVGAAAMGAIGEKPELAIRALLFVGLAEGIAIYGLIIAIMILGKV